MIGKILHKLAKPPMIDMTNIKKILVSWKLFLTIPMLLCVLFANAHAQGTIFGQVKNSDYSTPLNGYIYFIGYLDNTDEEIRLTGCTGAGYDNGYWFDDFQNYLTEAVGNPYDFHFFNFSTGEGAVLSGSIPFDSYHQADVYLSPFQWPDPPNNVDAILLPDSTVRISWEYQPGNTYRIYRRTINSNGSFFRVDDPTGSLANPGIDDSLYIDSSVDSASGYSYVVIPVNNGIIGRYSNTVSVHSDPDYFVCGDADGNGIIQIFDISFMVAYLYLDGPAPERPEAANCDGRPELNIFDITYLVYYLYLDGPAPVCE
jgi:hypothetical protein